MTANMAVIMPKGMSASNGTGYNRQWAFWISFGSCKSRQVAMRPSCIVMEWRLSLYHGYEADLGQEKNTSAQQSKSNQRVLGLKSLGWRTFYSVRLDMHSTIFIETYILQWHKESFLYKSGFMAYEMGDGDCNSGRIFLCSFQLLSTAHQLCQL